MWATKISVSGSSSGLKRRKPVEETFERLQPLITLSSVRFFPSLF